ncbi:MAG: nuclear transport factor 2 family protein [Candidatus Ozemobacteraceae bacterium]
MNTRKCNVPSIVCLFAAIFMLTWGSGLVFAAGPDDAAIDKVRLDFNAAFNTGKAEAFGKLIDGNAIWLPPGEPVIVGKDSIMARYGALLNTASFTFELKPGDIQVCDGWAFMSGDSSKTETRKVGGATKVVEGHYLFVLKKHPDGTWMIVRDIWSDTVKP